MDITNYILSKKYIEDSLEGAGAVKGKSAYEIAVDNGFKGSETDWLNSLIGDSPIIGENGHWFVNDQDTGVIASPVLAGYATEEWVLAEIKKIEFPKIDLSPYATTEEVKQAINNIEIPEVDLSQLATKEEVRKQFDNLDIPEVDLSDYPTKEEVNNQINDIKIPQPDLSSYATKEFVEETVANIELSSGAIVESLTPEEILDIIAEANGNTVDIKGNRLVAMTEEEVKDITSNI